LLGGALKRALPLGLAAAGLTLSLILEFLHVQAYRAPSAASFCVVGATLDCSRVALSRYSVLFGLPVPVWGALGFAAIGTAAWLRSRWLLLLCGLAVAASLALLALEVVKIGALCLLCEAVKLVTFLLLGVAWRQRQELAALPSDRENDLLVLSPAVGLGVALALFMPRYWGVFSWKGDVPFAHGTTAEGYPWLGAENPKITIDEYTDYGCPHCKAASARSLTRLAGHARTLRIVRHQYPRMICGSNVLGGCALVRAAYCADEQGKFWQLDRWAFEHGLDRPAASLDVAANEIGLDTAKLRSCMERRDTYIRAENETRLAVRKKIPGTPTFVVNGKQVGEETLSSLLGGH